MYHTYLRSRTFGGVKVCEPLHLYTLALTGFTDFICHREYFPCTYLPLKTPLMCGAETSVNLNYFSVVFTSTLTMQDL